MTSDDIALVRTSWAQLQPQAEQVGAALYQRMFNDHPELRRLFKGEMDEQAHKLMRMVNRTVDTLDDLTSLNRVIIMMGAGHSGFGVEDEDYPKMRNALVATLDAHLGSAFTPETRSAWIRVYGELAELMMEGAAS